MAGDEEVSDSRIPGIGSRPPIPGSGPIADCTASSPSGLAWLGDGVLRVVGIFVPDLGVSLRELNGAAALGPGSKAAIQGRGLNIAVGGGVIGATRGVAAANARNTLSVAAAVGAMGGDGYAESLFGVGLGIGALGRGAVGDAKALPAGIAVAVSTVAGTKATATALGGFALASNTGADGDRAVCTGVYAHADLGNGDSCTSILFFLQRYERGDGTVFYAIKNPLALSLVAPVTGGVSSAIAAALDGFGAGAVADLAGTRFIPAFQSDLVRVEVAPDGSWRLGTDVFDWLGGLIPRGGTSRSSDLVRVPEVLGDSLEQTGDALQSVNPTPLTDDEIHAVQCADAAGTSNACPSTLKAAGTDRETATPRSTELLTAVDSPAGDTPIADSLAVNPPVVEAPVVEAPVVDPPTVDSTVPERPALDGPGIDGPAVPEPAGPVSAADPAAGEPQVDSIEIG